MEDATQKLADTLAGIWVELLQVESVGSDDDFFYLGGDSLSATTLMNEIENRWGCEVLLSAIYEQPVLNEFAQHLLEAYPQIRS